MHDRLRTPAGAPCLSKLHGSLLQDAALLHLVRNVQRFPEHILRAFNSWARGCACSHVRWRSGAGCTLPRLRVSPSRSACRLSSSAITLLAAAAAQRVFSCCYDSGHRPFSDTRCGPLPCQRGILRRLVQGRRHCFESRFLLPNLDAAANDV